MVRKYYLIRFLSFKNNDLHLLGLNSELYDRTCFSGKKFNFLHKHFLPENVKINLINQTRINRFRDFRIYIFFIHVQYDVLIKLFCTNVK